MKLINKKNFFSVFCQAFTIVGLMGTIVDIVCYHEINGTQFNILAIAAGCFVSVLILSQSYRLEHLSPLKAVLLQYCAAIACMMAITWLSGLREPVNPHGYRDMFVTFSIPYLIGSMLYLYRLKKEIVKQNQDIQLIRRLTLEKGNSTHGSFRERS